MCEVFNSNVNFFLHAFKLKIHFLFHLKYCHKNLYFICVPLSLSLPLLLALKILLFILFFFFFFIFICQMQSCKIRIPFQSRLHLIIMREFTTNAMASLKRQFDLDEYFVSSLILFTWMITQILIHIGFERRVV